MALEEIDITASGTLSASTLNTNLLFVGGNQISPTKAFFPVFSATTFSASTIYSGNTNLYNIFQPIGGDVVSNIVTVGKGGDVQFNSVKSALDSITDNSFNQRYVIVIAPGKYIEDTLVMKQFVELWGYADYSTIIEVNATSKDVIVLTGNTTINNLVLQGSTDTGKSVFAVNGSFGPGIVCEIKNCTFGHTDIVLRSYLNAGQYAIVGANNSNTTYFTNCNKFFDIGGSGDTIVSWANTKNTVQCSIDSYIEISGGNNTVILSDVGTLVSSNLGGSINNFVRAYEGATVDFSSVSIYGADTAIFADNIGTAPNIKCASMNIFSSTTYDINILHSGTTGFYEGFRTFPMCYINPDSNFFIFNHDAKVINVAKSGGDFSSIKDAVDFITDSSENNRYKIYVGAGEFFEDEIDLSSKPYISVVGSAIQTTIIKPNTNTQNIFKIGALNELSFMWLDSAGSGYAGIYVADANYAQAHKVTFNNCDTNIIVESNITDTYFYGEYLDCNGAYSYGVKIISNNNFVAYSNLENFYNYPGVSGVTGVYIKGSNAQANLLASGHDTTSDTGFPLGGTAFYLEDGAFLDAKATTIVGWDYGIHVANVGAASELDISSTDIESSAIYDILIEHPDSFGNLQCSAAQSLISINPDSDINILIQDKDDGSLDISDRLNIRFNNGTLTDVSTAIVESSTMGIMEGGEISYLSGLTVNVADGFGYLEQFPDNDVLQKLVWSATTITLNSNTENYLYFNQNNILSASASRPDTIYNILLGRVVTNSTGVTFVDSSPLLAEHTSNRLSIFSRDALGPVYASGSITTMNTAHTFSLNVTAGKYFYAENQFNPTGGTQVPFLSFFQNGSGGFNFSSTTVVDNAYYDNGSGSLISLHSGYYTKHTLYALGGNPDNYFLVYGQSQYSALTLVEQSNISNAPSYLDDAVVIIAGIIVQQGASGITEIQDLRPVIGFKAPSVAATTFHGNLLGLSNDDHKQYLLADGSRALTGNLNLGGNNIISAGTVNSVNIQAHASRHLPNGSDPLTTASASTLSNVNTEGIANSFSRSDHTHAHGSQSGGTTHNVVDYTNAGFMSSVDKMYLDIVPAVFNTKSDVSGTTFTGNIVAPSFSATTISGGTFYSGSTELSVVMQNLINVNDTFVQNGLNTYTAGTNFNPTINISAATLSSLNVSGSTILTSLISTTISGGTFYSGNTDVSTLFATPQNVALINAELITKANLSGATFTGGVIVTGLSGVTISGGTLYSGSTELSVIVQNMINSDETFVQSGLNTYTGGTNFRPTINVSAATLSSLNVSGSSVISNLSASTISGSTIYSGNTDVSLLFATPQNISLINSQLVTKSNLSGATFTGGIITPSLSANTLSGGTLYSGATELSVVMQSLINSNETFVQNGLNTYTAGTNFRPIINVSAATLSSLNVSGNSSFNSLSANTLSANTIYSGSSDISTLFATPQNISLINSELNTKANLSGATFVGNVIAPNLSANTISGLTLYSGSTDLSLQFASSTLVNSHTNQLGTKANLSGATFTGNVIASNLSATTISGSTLYSGLTELSVVIQTMINSDETFLQNGLNTYTGGTNFRPTVNISAATLSSLNVSGNSLFSFLSASTISGSTLYSGNTDISILFATPQNVSLINSQLVTKSNLSGATFVGGIIAPSLSAVTISGGTLYSGSTELSTIIQTLINTNETFIQGGLNTYTGGTNFRPTINISAATLNNLNVSGSSNFNALSAVSFSSTTIYSGASDISTLFATPQNISLINSQIATKSNLSGATFVGNIVAPSLSANTISGSTIYSGSSDISVLFATPQNVSLINSQLVTKSNLSGATFTGGVIVPNLSANTLSGGTLYSGTTELSVIVQNLINSNETFIQGGLNIYTGGTNFRPTVNISAATLSNLNVSGNSIFISLTANSVSASTFYSGNTDVSTLFATPQNITSINTQLITKANLSGATFTGNVIIPVLSATTISGGTLYSGSTELSVVMQNLINSNETFVQGGLNTYTGGTIFKPTVNISAATLSSLNVSGNSVFNVLSAVTLSASTILSGSTDLYNVFLKKNGYLLQKAGSVSGSTFSGNPKKAIVTFNTAFASTNYAISVIGDVSRSWTVESLTISGFTINSNANTTFTTNNVYWTAIENGEGYR